MFYQLYDAHETLRLVITGFVFLISLCNILWVQQSWIDKRKAKHLHTIFKRCNQFITCA